VFLHQQQHAALLVLLGLVLEVGGAASGLDVACDLGAVLGEVDGASLGAPIGAAETTGEVDGAASFGTGDKCRSYFMVVHGRDQQR
jgi:hypothetical protein